MSSVVIELEEGSGTLREIAVGFEMHETAGQAIGRLEASRQFEHGAVLDAVIFEIPGHGEKSKLVEILWPEQPIRVKTVEVTVHFEGEIKTHRFPVHAKWARVANWAYHAFAVASDAVPHLELHEDSANGPALNPRQEIGAHPHHKQVWLVKPGAEPNG